MADQRCSRGNAYLKACVLSSLHLRSVSRSSQTRSLSGLCLSSPQEVCSSEYFVFRVYELICVIPPISIILSTLFFQAESISRFQFAMSARERVTKSPWSLLIYGLPSPVLPLRFRLMGSRSPVRYRQVCKFFCLRFLFISMLSNDFDVSSSIILLRSSADGYYFAQSVLTLLISLPFRLRSKYQCDCDSCFRYGLVH